VTVAVLASAPTQVACGGADSDTTAEPPARRASDSTPERIETSPRRADDMNITLSFNATELSATLVDSETTQDFLSLLPLTLMLSDYRETEKVSDLPRQLSTAGAPDGHDPEVGADGLRIAAALCCGLPLPSRFQMRLHRWGSAAAFTRQR
jgi:hypothetical protein